MRRFAGATSKRAYGMACRLDRRRATRSVTAGRERCQRDFTPLRRAGGLRGVCERVYSQKQNAPPREVALKLRQ